MHRTCLPAIVLLAASGCVSYFDGSVAELEPAPELRVITAASRYGECFREGQQVPVLYEVTRPSYSVRIAHGMRYYPELWLVARSNSGAALDIRGKEIKPVMSPTSPDMQRLRSARGTDVTHVAALDVPMGSEDGQDLTVKAAREGRIPVQLLTFDVYDPEGRVLGHERLRYHISIVRCRAVTGP